MAGADKQQTIDAVITWVDGNEQAHRDKLNAYLESLGQRPAAAHPTRFRECGELAYCLTSLLKFAPFLRKIFIVTDNQYPCVLKQLVDKELAQRLEVIDHRVIFRGYEQVLPTFNSLTIETMLWRIPDLAEHFIYFNDDVMLLQPVAAEDFFVDGKPVLRAVKQKQSRYRWSKRLRNWFAGPPEKHNPGFKYSQERAAQRLGFARDFYRLDHTPHPLRRSTFATLFAEHPQWFIENIQHKLRHRAQFSPVALAYHWQVLQQQAVLAGLNDGMNVKPRRYPLARLERKLNRTEGTKFACVQSLDLASPEQCALIIGWLRQRIGGLSTSAVRRDA